jgi:hypothetical protein
MPVKGIKMNDLKKLLARCKCGVHIDVNTHRDVYETAEEYLNSLDQWKSLEDVSTEVRVEMVRTNTIICIQAYPDTPIGFYGSFHYDFDTAVNEVLNAINQGDET